MKRLLSFLMKIVVEGFLIVLPLLLFYMLLGELFDTVTVLTAPIHDLLPGKLQQAAEGKLLSFLLGLLLVVVIGLIARTQAGRKMGHWLEETILNRMKMYTLLRDIIKRFGGEDIPGGLSPALMTVGPGTRSVVFVVETHADGEFTVFVPYSPTPGIGSVQIVDSSRIQMLDASMGDAVGTLLNWGMGTAQLPKPK